MSNHPSGFDGFQSRCEALAEALGGHHFARVAMAREFANKLRNRVSARMNYDERRGLTFSEYLLATREDFDKAADLIEGYILKERRFASGVEPAVVAQSEPVAGGRIVLRDDHALWFETGQAMLLLINASKRDGSEQWMIGLTDDAEAFYQHVQGHKPAQSLIHAKSAEGAIKALYRMAEQVFAAPLKKL